MRSPVSPFATLLTLVLALIGGYLLFDLRVLLWMAIALGLIGLFWEGFRVSIHRIWFELGRQLGRINGAILLSIIFFLILTPIAWLRRLISGNPLELKQPEDSLLQGKPHLFEPDDLTHPW